MLNTLLVGLGGALGSAARYWIALWALPLSRALPVGTIAINIAGSFVIGLFGSLTGPGGRWPLGEPARLFVMVGVCGGFTTFSSFSLQTLDLLRAGALPRAFANIALSVALCLGAVAAGYACGVSLGGAHQVAASAAEEDAG